MKFKIDAGFAGFFYDALLCVALYLLCVSVPCFIPDFSQTDFTGILRWVFLFPIGWVLLHKGMRPNLGKWKTFLICLPLVAIGLGNMISLLTTKEVVAPAATSLLWSGLLTLGTAITEEFVFRFGALEALQKTSWKGLSIPISAAIFGLFHIFALLAGSPILPTLAQVGYTFFLGLILGVAYQYGGIFASICIHLLFNFLQTDLYLACGGGTWDMPFYLWNIGLAIFALGYAVLLFILMRRGKPQENPTPIE